MKLRQLGNSKNTKSLSTSKLEKQVVSSKSSSLTTPKTELVDTPTVSSQNHSSSQAVSSPSNHVPENAGSADKLSDTGKNEPVEKELHEANDSDGYETENDSMEEYQQMLDDIKDFPDIKKKIFERLLSPGHKYLNLNPFSVYTFFVFFIDLI